MGEVSKPHKTPTLMHAEALSVLLAYDGYDGPFHESDARAAMGAACRMARHIERLFEQLEALERKLAKTRAEAEEYRELWQEAEGRS